jgi:hypothetical protein
MAWKATFKGLEGLVQWLHHPLLNCNFGLRPDVRCGLIEGPIRAVPVQAGKVCNHRASPNRHLSSIPRNGYSPANMQCAARATARRDPLVDGKLEHQLMTAFEKIHPSFPSAVQGPQWAVRVERPKRSDFDSFRNCQRIFKFNTQVSDRAVHLRMPQQKLNGAQVACLLINLGDLRASH